MSSLTRPLITAWVRLGPRFLPFADAASADLPLSKLLRLSLFQVSVGMALVLLVGTLNRVMIVELGVSAALVAIMVSLPVLYAPMRALIGFRSDNHRSALGWRRVPYIWMGTLLQFGGLATMPFALLVLSGGGNAAAWPAWVGPAGAAVSFGLVGAGLHTAQTAGLALATDLAPTETQPRVVGLMYVMLLLGAIVSGLAFGAFLGDFSPARLVQVIQAAAVITLVLNTLALWKQEPRHAAQMNRPVAAESFREAWAAFVALPGVRGRLRAIGLGTLGFGMQDVLLEPYGGQMLGLSVGSTTWLSATLAAGGLTGFAFASRQLGRGGDPARLSRVGTVIGIPGFLGILVAPAFGSVGLFTAGVALIGLGGGLFGHATLTLTMNQAPKEQTGLALGAWGAVQATAAGVAMAAGGILSDLVGGLATRGFFGASLASATTGYDTVYLLEIALLVGTCWMMRPKALGHVAVVLPGGSSLQPQQR